MARTLGPRSRPASPARAGALLWRLPRNLGALAILAGVVLIAGFSLAALPGYLARMSDAGLRKAIGEAPPFARNIALTQVSENPLQPNGGPSGRGGDVVGLAGAGEDLLAAMPGPVRATIRERTVVADGPRWIVRPAPGDPAFPFPRFLQLRYQNGLDDRIRLQGGRLPAAREPEVVPTLGADPLPVFETALTPSTARALGLAIGDRVIVVSDPDYWRATQLRRQPAPYQLVIEVVGLFEPANADDEYWFAEPFPLRPIVIETPDITLIYAAGLLAPDAYRALHQRTTPEAWTYQWRYFVETARIDQAGVADLNAGLQRLSFAFPATATRVTTGLPELVRRFAVQRQLAISILALAAVGLAAVAAVVLGVLAALLAERRRAALELVRGRGASLPQLIVAQAAEGLAVGLPVAALGWGLASALLPAPDPRWPLLTALGVALACALLLVAATVLAIRRQRGGVAPASADRRVALLRRLLFEALIAGLAAVGVVLLRRRGLAETERAVDPYLVAVPVLLGGAVGLLVLRLLPVVVRLILPPVARGRGLVAFLGLRRLTRPVGAQLPLLAVLLAVALAAFAATIQGSIARVQADAAWQQVGADYRLDLPVGAGAVLPALDLAGGGATAIAPSATIATNARVTILALDVASYSRVAAGTPAEPRFPAALLAPSSPTDLGERGNPIPAIVSANWPLGGSPQPGAAFSLDLSGEELHFVAREVRDSFPGLPAGTPFVVAPLDDVRAAIDIRRFAASTAYFVRAPAGRAGALDAAARAQGAAGVVVDRGVVYDAARDAPLVTGVTTGFRWSLALTTLLAALAVAAVAEGVARERARERASLRLLGLRERQATALAILELLPPIAVAGIAGGALGIAMSRLLGPAIDLSVFTAPGLPVALQPEWGLVALLACAVIGAALVAALLVGALVGRLSPGELLREGNR